MLNTSHNKMGCHVSARIGTHTLTTSASQRGVSMIESLVAIVVTTLGILGVLGVQMRTMTDTASSVRRSQAVQLVEDLGERMQSNPDALNNFSTFASVPSDQGTDCSTTACTPAQLATYEIYQWQAKVGNSLPSGSAKVYVPKDSPRQLAVLIGWRETQTGVGGKAATASETEKTSLFSEVTLKDAADATVSCPTGLICHLQYLQPTQRCTPWTVGGGSLYCPN